MKRYLNILHLVLFISIAVFQHQAFAQDSVIDSLKLVLKKVNHDTTRCNILNQLIEAESNDEIWPLYNEQLLHIAEKNLKETTFLRNIYLKNIAIAKNNLGYLANLHGDNLKAISYYKYSLEIQKQINYRKGMASTMYNLGDIFMLQGNISEALEYLHRSLKIQEDIRDTFGQCYSLNNIGSLYKNQRDIPNALFYLKKALKLREGIKDKQGVANTLINLGNIFRREGEDFKAIDYYTRSLHLMEEINDKRGVGLVLNSIGSVYYSKDELVKALEYYQRSFKTQEAINDKAGLATSLNNMASTLYELGGPSEKALNYSMLSLNIAKELGFPAEIKNAAYTLKKIYVKQHNFKKAFESYELYLQMRDSINNKETKKVSIKKQFQYQYEKQAAADSVKHAEEQKVKNAQLTSQASSLKQEKTQRYALYGGLLLVIAFLGFVFNRFKVTQKQKVIIENQKISVDKAYESLHERNKEVMDSIHYARRIQRALLTPELYIERVLNNLNKK